MGGGLVGLHILIPRFKGMKIAIIVGDMSDETRNAVDRWLEQKETRRFIQVHLPESDEFTDQLYKLCKKVCDQIRALKPIDNSRKGGGVL